MAIEAVEEFTPKGVLAGLLECDLVEREIGARRLLLATIWADQHPAVAGLPFGGPIEATLDDDGTRRLAVAAVAEFAAVLGVSTESGAGLLADALELRDRLPRTWEMVQTHRMLAWKARRVAQHTRHLPAAGATWIDVQTSLLGDRLTETRTRKLVLLARDRFDPDGVPDPVSHRWVNIRPDQSNLDGATHVDALLDTPDALDLAEAISAVAAELAAWGSTDDLDNRQAQALDVLARQALGQETLPNPEPAADFLDTGASAPHSTYDANSPHPADRVAGEATAADRVARVSEQIEIKAGAGRPGRQVILYIHLSQQAITADGGCLAEVGTTGQLVTADEIRNWCETAGKIIVRPVIDLNTDQSVPSYTPTSRMREQIALRDRHCVFPWCTRPARPVRRPSGEYGFDADHIIPWNAGGETSTDNLACLCRKHHRLKTHTGWDYRTIGPGEYWWTSPNGYQFLRTSTGTTGLPPPI